MLWHWIKHLFLFSSSSNENLSQTGYPPWELWLCVQSLLSAEPSAIPALINPLQIATLTSSAALKATAPLLPPSPVRSETLLASVCNPSECKSIQGQSPSFTSILQLLPQTSKQATHTWQIPSFMDDFIYKHDPVCFHSHRGSEELLKWCHVYMLVPRRICRVGSTMIGMCLGGCTLETHVVDRPEDVLFPITKLFFSFLWLCGRCQNILISFLIPDKQAVGRQLVLLQVLMKVSELCQERLCDSIMAK